MRRVSASAWREYVEAHARVQSAARNELVAFFDTLPWGVDDAAATAVLVEKAVEIARLYGIADATLSAAFYDEVMEMFGAVLPPADVLAPSPQFVAQDVADAVSTAKSAESARTLAGGAVAGHVKRAGVETMMGAAQRDGAMWAWVCIGDTCAFCRALGSNGWQYASRSVRAGNHAEHIHDGCDCQFMVKPKDASLDIDGYDPEKLLNEYLAADSGGTSKDKINAMRRAAYTPEAAKRMNARRRELYRQANDND